MRESLSPELQQAMTLDADGRYTFFIQQAVANGKLWILKDEQGCMLLTADEDDCIPVWPHADYAKAWAAEEWANCEPYAVPLKTWLDRWGRCEQVPDMRSCLSSGAMKQGSS